MTATNHCLHDQDWMVCVKQILDYHNFRTVAYTRTVRAMTVNNNLSHHQDNIALWTV